MDTRIYVMTHKKIADIPEDIYLPLHVGREGKEDLGYLGDHTGDNISCKNSNYCELTGMFWLWKNVHCDVIGICHYRRFFLRNGRLIKKNEIEQLIKKFPIIIPNSVFVDERNVYEHYKKKHESRDLDLCREVIAERQPKYIPSFDYVMDTILISRANMWITRKDIYDRYCQWLFDILFEVEKRLDLTGYDEYQQRVMGFLSERLFRVWLLMQPEKIAEEKMELTDSEPQKRRELMLRVLQLKLEPVINMHKNKAGTFIEKFECHDDFEGKTPVWFCFLPGENEMPETVRFCYLNAKCNFLEEKKAFRFITLENCLEYASLSPTLIEKFNGGILDMMQLTDIFRAELLYRYGGIWIDMDMLILPSGINDFCAIPKESSLLRFLLESLWYYYEIEDKKTDDKMLEDILALAICRFPEYQLGDGWERNFLQPETEDSFLETRYIPERYDTTWTEKHSCKMDAEKVYLRNNILGFQTIYGYLAEQMQL